MRGISLQEEYIKRHKLKVPVIVYDPLSCVVLRSVKKPYSYRAFRITWNHVTAHPGYYHFDYVEANHDGFDRISPFRYFTDLDKNIEDGRERNCKFTDEYDDFVMTCVQKSRSDGFVAVPYPEQFLTCCHMFFYMCDKVISSNFDILTFRNIANSFDPELDLDSRVQAASESLAQVYTSSSCRSFWNSNIDRYSNTHSKWLADLINES